MTCYFRHLQDFFEEAGIKVTPTNRRDIDRALHEILEVEYKNCPSAWRKLKTKLKDERSRRDLIAKLKAHGATL